DSFKVYDAVVRRIALKPASVLGSPSYGLGDLLRNVVDDRIDYALGAGMASEQELNRARKAVDHWLLTTVSRTPCESHSFRQAIVGFARAYLDQNYEHEQLLEAWL